MSAPSLIKKFLIVEDSVMERALLRGLLKKYWPQCEILEAVDGVEGLAAVEQGKPDLILTDTCMPKVGGLELLSALREKRSLVPVIVISGLCDAETAVAAMQAGAASFIPKSKLSELLVSTVNKVAEQAVTHRNHRRIIGGLKSMDLRFELENDCELILPLVKYLEDLVGSMYLCDEHELMRIGVALYEAISNAIHHGNLELDSELRQEEESIYYELAQARKVTWPYCDRKVHVFASLYGERIKFVIRDEGHGFRHAIFFDSTSEENLNRIGGRGLLLIHSFMDEVNYNNRGNEITLVKYTSKGQKLLAEMAESATELPGDEFEVSSEVVLLHEEPAESLNVV